MFDKVGSGARVPSGPPDAAGATPDGVPAELAASVAAADAAGARLDRVAALAPGPLQVGLLAMIDPATLDHAGRVDLLQAWERASRWITARQLDAVVAVAGPKATNRDDFAREDVRAALRQVGGSWRQDVDLARALHGPLARAGQALAAGTLSYPQARALQQETEPLDPATTRAVCDQLLADARTRTPADFRRRVRAAVIAADPIGAALRAEQATKRRQVTRRVLADGQAGLDLTGPATAIAAIWAVLTRHAGLAHPDDPRTLDQRRFDALLDICRTATTDRLFSTITETANAEQSPHAAANGSGEAGAPEPRHGSGGGGGRPARRRDSRTGTSASVFVFADAATWAGLADNPVDLDGYGPIPAGMARDCFTDAQWRAVVTDALTGLVASVSDDTYTPSPRTRRHLYAQDRGCLFPACPAEVWYCDADHSVPHDQGGCTDPDNCGLLCRRHHRLKTHSGWTWTRYDDGTVAWTSPDGHVWTRPPQRYHHVKAPPRPPDARSDAAPRGHTDPHAGPAPTRAGPERTRPDHDTPPF